MTVYEKYKKFNIDLSCLGLEKGEAESDYFCTPVGAKVIGRAGVDGIHFCFIRGFGDTVFSVSPMNMQGDYVHPLAKSFNDFLRLLLSCGHTAAIEQAHFWNKEQFDVFLSENQPTEEQLAVLNAFKEAFELAPIEQPFDYIKNVQSDFDYRKLRFKKDYYEWVPPEPRVPTAPEWKVYYRGGFFGHHGKDRAGKAIAVNKQFAWGEYIWYIPAVYACSAGLVVDFCVKVEPERIAAFIDKWNLLEDEEGRHLTSEQREQLENENPLDFNFSSQVIINGKTVRSKGGSRIGWVPNMPDGMGNDLESKWVLEHYGLDLSNGWSIHRVRFPWATKNKPNIKSLDIALMQSPVSVFGTHFNTPKVGESVTLTHPITGNEYKLTAEEVAQAELDVSGMQNEEFYFPTHYTRMTYNLSPDLPDKAFRIQDCVQSDSPRRKNVEISSNTAVSIGIIGGADGPTALFFGGQPNESKLKMSLSSLHFEPTDNVEWRMIFNEKMCDDITVRNVILTR